MAIILIGSGCFSPRLVICPSKHSVNKGSASIIRPRRRKFCASFQVALSAAGCLSPIKRVCVARTLCNFAAGISRSPGRSSWETSAMLNRVTSSSGWSGPSLGLALQDLCQGSFRLLEAFSFVVYSRQASLHAQQVSVRAAFPDLPSPPLHNYRQYSRSLMALSRLPTHLSYAPSL